MIKIAPSILSADFTKLAEQVESAFSAGADWLHVDVMDGHFVPNITFGPLIVKAVRKLTRNTVDVHLMIENPDNLLEEFAEAGADVLTVHVEAAKHLWSTCQKIKDLGIKVGVTLNPATPVTMLDPVLELADLVLVMSVEPGFGGQSFIESSLPRLNYLAEKKLQKSLTFEIEVDGGVNTTTASQVVNAGAEILVVGSAIFGKKDIPQAITDIRNAIA